MDLLHRKRYSNTYDTGRREGRRRILRADLGGVPNVPIDEAGTLAPLDNELTVDAGNPDWLYKVKRGPLEIGFQDPAANQYRLGMRLRDGPKLLKHLVDSGTCDPALKNPHTMRWEYPSGTAIEEYTTERWVKETVLQKAGQTLTWELVHSGGLTPRLGPAGDLLYMYRGQVAFRLQRPYYTNEEGEFLGWVPYSVNNVGGFFRVTYPAPASDVLVDPTIEFGEGGGAQVGGDHKDTWVRSDVPGASYGTNTPLYVRGGAFYIATLLRWDLSGHIPAGATINVADAYLKSNTTATQTIGAHRLSTDFGVGPTDEGPNESPATGGQATWRRSFDFNGGGGDVGWAGATFGAGDYQAAEDLVVYTGANLWNVFQIPIMCQYWLDTQNYGVALVPTTDALAGFYSQEDGTVANRPYLSVEYTERVSGFVPAHIFSPRSSL